MSTPAGESYYEFGRLRLKPPPKYRVLECEGKTVRLHDQWYDILLILVRCRRIVTREELIEAIWPDDVVSRKANLHVNITELRNALKAADPSVPEQLIKNHKGKGYTLEVEVSEHEILTTVAILPFKVEGAPEKADDDGFKLADKLTAMLSRNMNISVRRSDTVIREYASHPDQRPLIFGHRLATDYVFSGRILREQEVIEVEALDVRADEIRSSPPFESWRPVVHWSIHEWMESILGLPPTPRRDESETQYTKNPEANKHYMSGRQQRFRSTEGSLKRAISLFKRAIKADPDFAEAYVGVAGTYIFMGMLGLIPPQSSHDGAMDAAAMALLKNPRLAGAHSTWAFIKLFFEREWDEARDGFARAIEIKGNYPAAHMGYAHYLTARGRHTEALAEIDEALEDPYSFFINFVRGMILFLARKFDKSLKQFEWTQHLNHRFQLKSDLPYYGISLAQEYCALTREADEREELFKKADEQAQLAIRMSKGNALKLLHRAQLLAMWGKRDEAEHLLNAVLELRHSRHYVSPYHLAIVYTALREVEKAIARLEEAPGVMDQYLFLTGVDPRLDSLRSDPGFQEFLRQLGLGD